MSQFINEGKVIALTLDQANKIRDVYNTKAAAIVPETVSMPVQESPLAGAPLNDVVSNMDSGMVSNVPVNDVPPVDPVIQGGNADLSPALETPQTNADVIMSSLEQQAPTLEPVDNQNIFGVSPETNVMDNNINPNNAVPIMDNPTPLADPVASAPTLEPVSFPQTNSENPANNFDANGVDAEIEELRRNLTEIITIAQDSIDRVFADYYVKHPKDDLEENIFTKAA